MPTSYSITQVTGTPTATSIAVSMPFLSADDISARVSESGETLANFKRRLAMGAISAAAGTTVASSILSLPNAALANGATRYVEIRRATPQSALAVSFSDRAVIKDGQLNKAQNQGLYIDQEIVDSLDRYSSVFPQGAVKALASGVETGTVTFLSPFAVAPETVVATMEIPPTGSVIFVSVSSITTSGFTFYLSAPTTDTSYKIRYIALP